MGRDGGLRPGLYAQGMAAGWVTDAHPAGAVLPSSRSCPWEWLSIRIRLVKVALAFRSLRRCEGRQRSSMGLHLSVVCLIQSYPDAGEQGCLRGRQNVAA